MDLTVRTPVTVPENYSEHGYSSNNVSEFLTRIIFNNLVFMHVVIKLTLQIKTFNLTLMFFECFLQQKFLSVFLSFFLSLCPSLSNNCMNLV